VVVAREAFLLDGAFDFGEAFFKREKGLKLREL